MRPKLELIQVLPDSEEEREETFRVAQEAKRDTARVWEDINYLSKCYVSALSQGPEVMAFIKLVSEATGIPLMKAPARFDTWEEAVNGLGSPPLVPNVRRRIHTLSKEQLAILERIKGGK